MLEDQRDGMRVRIWERQGSRPVVDRVIGARLAVTLIEAVKGILQTRGGFDTYGR